MFSTGGHHVCGGSGIFALFIYFISGLSAALPRCSIILLLSFLLFIHNISPGYIYVAILPYISDVLVESGLY